MQNFYDILIKKEKIQMYNGLTDSESARLPGFLGRNEGNACSIILP